LSPTALLFVLGFAAGCFLALKRHPIFGLLTYVGVFYLHPPARWWGQGMLFSVRWSFIAAAVTLIALALHRKSLRPTLPLRRSGAFWGFLILVAWIVLQSLWALDPEAHEELRSIYLKFVLVFVMICKCIDTEKHLRYFFWAHVLGCFYLGWIAYTSYGGGRFEGFGSPGIDDANAAALQVVTGIVVGGALFLGGNLRVKAVLTGVIPVIVNALVTTISRSGFLAVGVAGLIYNLFAPRKYRGRVRLLSVLAVFMFAMLTTDSYWQRMDTIKYQGADVEGVDTGGGRLEIIQAQWLMAKGRPFGCGHMCTTVLSPFYIDARFLSEGARASHNTFMTMVVDHGVVGAAIYLAMLLWIYRNVRKAFKWVKGEQGFLATVLPAVAAVLAAISVADMFAQYPKFEARIWFISVLMVIVHMSADRTRVDATQTIAEPVAPPGQAKNGRLPQPGVGT
jgi:hypothetical protein